MSQDQAVKCRLPDHLEERTSSFRSNLHHRICDKKLEKSQIACMDELFLHLTNSSAKEQRQYSVGLQKHCGSPGATATVFLCTTADGNMLPPLLVLKVDRVIISVRTQKNCKRFIKWFGQN